MKTKYYFLTLFMLLFLHCNNSNYVKDTSAIEQNNISVKSVTKLANQLKETSGLIFFNNTFWTLNDSGGKANLYAFDKNSGKITKTISIKNAKNIDWEDLAQDKHYIYIADTGNNAGKRKEFQIYKVAKNDILNIKGNKGKVNAEKITFSFKNVPKNVKTHNHNFDIESLIIKNGQILFFTKNWADRKSNCYQIKNGFAQKIASYNPKGLLTGADYDVANNRIIAIGYHKYEKIHHKSPFLIIITHFNTPKERFQKYSLPDINGLQVEGICLVKNNIFITNEKNKAAKQSLKQIIFE